MAGICWLDKLALDRKLNCMSEALQYLTDETGKKTAVVLPITDYEKLLEDLEDLAAIAERRQEPTISHEQFKEELRRDGLL
jgi:predicted DNA-binding protein